MHTNPTSESSSGPAVAGDTPTPPPASASIPVSAETAHRLAAALRTMRNGGTVRHGAVDSTIAALSSAVPAGPAGEGGDPFAHVKVGDPDPDPDADGASCHAERKHGCTREHGHQGQHIATDGHRVLGVWTDTATPQQPAEAAEGAVTRASLIAAARAEGVPQLAAMLTADRLGLIDDDTEGDDHA